MSLQRQQPNVLTQSTVLIFCHNTFGLPRLIIRAALARERVVRWMTATPFAFTVSNMVLLLSFLHQT